MSLSIWKSDRRISSVCSVFSIAAKVCACVLNNVNVFYLQFYMIYWMDGTYSLVNHFKRKKKVKFLFMDWNEMNFGKTSVILINCTRFVIILIMTSSIMETFFYTKDLFFSCFHFFSLRPILWRTMNNNSIKKIVDE